MAQRNSELNTRLADFGQYKKKLDGKSTAVEPAESAHNAIMQYETAAPRITALSDDFLELYRLIPINKPIRINFRSGRV